MMKRTDLTLLTVLVLVGIISSSFRVHNKNETLPTAITRSEVNDRDGEDIIQTEILLNKYVNREMLIHACQFLNKEGVRLTFEKLTIKKSVFGILGQERISYAKGKIELPNGSVEQFEAGGLLHFKSIKIIYRQNTETDDYTIQMIEIID